MNYDKFNQYIKEKFFPPEKKGETIIFSVDEAIIANYLENEGVPYEFFIKYGFAELTESWSAQCEDENYFGLCAIQVYIASLMHNDYKFTSGAYNPRFESFFGIDSNKRHKLFSNYQIAIWEKLEQWCNDNNFIINIPQKEDFQWNRIYVSYPLSQSLLNKEDLKKTSILFEKIGIKKSEYISFSDFSQLIENADNGDCINTHYDKIKARLLKDFGSTHQLYQQIYNYFVENWDGLYPQREELKIAVKRSHTIKQNIHFFLNKTHEYISILDDEYETIASVSLSDIDVFNCIEKYQNVYSEEFLIFKIETISEEAEYVRKFELGERYVIICKQNSKASNFIPSLCSAEKFENGIYDIFISQILRKKSNHHFWEKYFSLQSRNYKIEGGVKLGYKIWMLGCGPKIIFDEKSGAWINGKKTEEIEIDCTNFPIGLYKIVKDNSIEKIEIKAPLNTKNEDSSGWNIDSQTNKWEYIDENFQISGLINSFPKESETSTIKNWTEALTVRNIDIDYSSTILRAIKRAKYGI